MQLFKKKVYFISDDENWVAPEETLVDSMSDYADVEKPITGDVFRWVIVLCVTAIVFVSAFVFKLSILDNVYFAKLALQNKSANFPIPPPRGIVFDANMKPLTQNIPSYDLLVVTREVKDDYENLSESVASTLGLDKDEFISQIKSKIRSNALFFAANDLTKEQALAIELLSAEGFYVVTSTERDYPDSRVFSTVLGYTGKVTKDDLDDDKYYYPTDEIGRQGVEAQYELALRGEHGNIFFTQEQEGSVNKNSTPGQSIVLNVDYGIQSQLHKAMHQVLSEAGLSRGAAIVQNPQNGAILAMVSFPTYDNNIFSDEVSELDFIQLFESRSRPLFNRAIGGTYNPGSTIKPYIGMTALQEKIITPSDTVKDCVSISIGEFTFRNWREEYGLFDLKKAIANSCNIYFYSIGGGFGNIRGLGISRISDYLKRGFADSTLGIDLPGERKGFVPTSQWKEEERGESWYLGDTYNVSIGQGDLSVTPLWINAYVSAIANNGNIWRPQIADSIVDKDGIVQKFEPHKIGELPFSDSVISEMKKDMEETTISGTARILGDLPVRAAAKTGTAEVIKGQSVNAIFTGFAPSTDAQVAITVLVENSASNQGYAIRVANSFLGWYFGERLNKQL